MTTSHKLKPLNNLNQTDAAYKPTEFRFFQSTLPSKLFQSIFCLCNCITLNHNVIFGMIQLYVPQHVKPNRARTECNPLTRQMRERPSKSSVFSIHVEDIFQEKPYYLRSQKHLYQFFSFLFLEIIIIIIYLFIIII